MFQQVVYRYIKIKGNDNYLIVGKQINPSDIGLEEKVGEGESLVRVSTALIDEKNN